MRATRHSAFETIGLAEAAQHLDIPHRTVHQLVLAGVLKGQRKRGRWWVLKTSVADLAHAKHGGLPDHFTAARCIGRESNRNHSLTRPAASRNGTQRKLNMRNPTIKRNKSVAAGLLALLAAVVLLLGTATAAAAQEQTADERARAQANNPLASMYALNFQNYYTPSLYGVPDRSVNNLWVRTAIPIGRTLTRASLPLATRPETATAAQSGLGDFNIFTAYLIVSNPTTSFGVGPLLVAPTATDDLLGQGKWQAGAAAVVFKATQQIQVGGLVTWQGSFAGDDARESTSFLAVQPFAVWQLGGGTYLRSTSIWGFDLESGDFAMPIGLGIGKVMKAGNTVYNMFFEPQFTFLHQGTGQPKVQLFAGIHFQFPK